MSQNIYDNPEFFAGYSQLRRQVDGLDGAPEWRSLQSMLGDVKGKRAVDLGCGFGWVSRWLSAHGARSVLGIDISEKMLARARATTLEANITYRLGNLEAIDLPAASFDLAFSSLAFHYVSDFGRLIGTIHAALTPGSRLVFSIEHPIYTAGSKPDWLQREDGRQVWPVDHYSCEGERHTDWFTKGVVKYHRTLGTTINTLVAAGFSIERVEEFAPSPDQIADAPDLAMERERPMFVLVSTARAV